MCDERGRDHMRHVARLLVVFLLVPALLVAGPGRAALAAGEGPWKAGRQTGTTSLVDWGSGVIEPGCAFLARWNDYDGIGDVSATIEVSAGKCQWIFSYKPSSITFEGPGCTRVVPLTAVETSAWYNPRDTVSFTGSASVFTGCEVTNYTMQGSKGIATFGTIALGDAAAGGPDVTGCTASLTSWRYLKVSNNNFDWWADDVAVYVTVTSAVPTTFYALPRGVGFLNNGAYWDLEANGITGLTAQSHPGGGASVEFQVGTATVGNSSAPKRTLTNSDTVSTQASMRTWAIVTPADLNLFGNKRQQWNGGQPVAPFTENTAGNKACAFHQGIDGLFLAGGSGAGPAVDDVVETPGDGGAAQADAPVEAGCNFSLTDPSTWASGGICALVYLMKQAVQLLQKIFGAIKDLAYDAVSFPVDAFGALFIPAPGYLDAAQSDVQASWQDSGPGEWGDAVGDVATSVSSVGVSGSGCGGPQLAGSVAGVSYDLQPLNACSAPMSSVSSVVKTLLSLMVIVGGIITGAQMLLSALGLNIRTPEGGAA